MVPGPASARRGMTPINEVCASRRLHLITGGHTFTAADQPLLGEVLTDRLAELGLCKACLCDVVGPAKFSLRDERSRGGGLSARGSSHVGSGRDAGTMDAA